MPNDQFVDYSLQLESNKAPTALVLPAEQEVVVGSIVRLDGRSSQDPEGAGLTYSWAFTQTPIGSQVETFGFTNIEEDSSVVGFAPDITGTYKVSLVVNDGSLNSEPDEAHVDVRVILVPNHQGYVPDASFIWNYLSDFWTLVPDRNRFETFWSAAIQITSSAMLKLYQYQYNKSIRDIQDTIQKRWISFETGIDLTGDTASFLLADDLAGSSASTFVIDSSAGVPINGQPSYSNVVTIPTTEGSFSKASVGRILQLENRGYTLARANPVFLSTDYGTDGQTTGSVTFRGTQFSANMVGSTLRILEPTTSTLLGDYKIASFVSSSEITVAAIHPGTTWAGQSGLTYSVIPAVAQGSSFFADQQQVPAGLESQHWRLSSTLISPDINFEQQGVSPGDLIEVEVNRLDINVLSRIFIQVVSVDRNRLGFVLNIQDLVAGQSAPGLTDDIQVTLASDLIVSGLSSNGMNLTYDLEAAEVKNTITSGAFKKTYYEKELTSDDEINVGPFSITARPIRIIRNTRMVIDDAFVSVPLLQEYVKQPDVGEDENGLYLATNGIKTPVSRRPYVLSENLDYIIDDESTITGSSIVTPGSDEIVIPHGDLIDRLVQEGDTIEITLGTTKRLFDIRRVVTADTLRVFPIPTEGTTSGLFTITRRIVGKFLRFVDGTFSKKTPAPNRLWSEVSYLDNGDAIEGNFGILVGVRRDDLSKVGSGIPYRSAVAGLMYALTNGPTVSNLTLSAQILTGLPFAQYAGVIKEINSGFRKREDGSPLYGRILVEGRDSKGNSTGTTNIYFYPEGRQVLDTNTGIWHAAVPNFSGIAINPETGVPYAVGDEITQFSPLSKGVDVEDYLSNPESVDLLVAQGDIAAQLRKYHSFKVVVNSDLITSVDVDLVAQFMRKVKAHYVRLTAALLKSLEDVLDITDKLTFGRLVRFFDNSDLGTPTAATFDPKDDNEAYLSLDGYLYTRLHVGEDLETTYGSPVVVSDSAGLITARVGNTEAWVAPKVRPGDLLNIVQGPNQGRYTIDAATDTQLTLTGTGTSNFQTLDSQRFLVYRPLKNPIFVGLVEVTNTGVTILTDELNGNVASIDTAGLSVGDTFVFRDTATDGLVSKRYKVIEVDPDDFNPTIKVTPAIAEATGTYTGWVVRDGLMTRGIVEPYGTTQAFRVNVTSAGSYINFVDTATKNSLNIALIRPGSEITVSGHNYLVLKFEPGARRALVTPPLLVSGTGLTATVSLRPDMASEPVSFDFLDRMPDDALTLELQSKVGGDTASTTSASKDLTLSTETPVTINALPGDYFILLEGADSLVDVGSGPGAFPIHQIVGGTTIRLADALSATGSFRYGLRRKVPNEG